MVKGLSSLVFNNSSEASLSSSTSFSTAASWQWPSCTQARTQSFRRCESPEIVSMRHDEVMENKEDCSFKTSVNPAYMLDPEEEDQDEAIVRSLRSNGRLFFEPESTSSIVKMQTKPAAFGGATALAIDSADPYGDFRRSMEEMVLSHGINDWGWLEEMLGWYLSANGKSTHGLIVGAFVDLLVALTSAPPPPSSSISTTANGRP